MRFPDNQSGGVGMPHLSHFVYALKMSFGQHDFVVFGP